MTEQKDIVSTDFPRGKKLQECHPIDEIVERHKFPPLTNPIHGGKITCWKCGKFILECDEVIPYRNYQTMAEFPDAHFHKACYNRYEHYYGLDKPID